jgi:opacity protein-like surface antigen
MNGNLVIFEIKKRVTMREIKIVVAACVVLLFASFAAAQVPTSGNVFFGYSYYNADLSTLGRSNLSGWTGSLEGRVFPHVGMVADFSQTFGSESVTILCPGPPCPSQSISAHEYNMLFGPRVSFSVGKLRPFAEALFGVGHVGTNDAGSNTSLATGLGGGVDYRIFRPIALRFEGDYLQTRFYSTTQNNLRLSTGIVFRF